MKVFENKSYDDDDGDGLNVECCDTHVELMTWSETGCWVITDPKVLRDIAAQLVRGAEHLEKNNEQDNKV